MSFLTSLAAAFKGGGGGSHVPLARNFVSPWATAFETSPRLPRFDYPSAVREGYLANPVAQRSVRIVAEGVGGAPLVADDRKLEALVRGSAGTTPLLEVLAAQLLLHGRRSRGSTPWSSPSFSRSARRRRPRLRPGTVTFWPLGPAAPGPGTIARWRCGPKTSGFISPRAREPACTSWRADRSSCSAPPRGGSELPRQPLPPEGPSRIARRAARSRQS